MRETQNPKYSVPSFIISHCVGSKGIHPRHPPREFPLGLRAPVLGMGTAQIPGNEPFPFLVGGRIPPPPVRSLVSSPRREHPAEAGQGSPHPAAQTPLRFFMSVFVVSLSLRYFVLHITQALVFSPDTLAEIPEGANANALDPVRLSTDGLPRPFARKFCSLKFFYI